MRSSNENNSENYLPSASYRFSEIPSAYENTEQVQNYKWEDVLIKLQMKKNITSKNAFNIPF